MTRWLITSAVAGVVLVAALGLGGLAFSQSDDAASPPVGEALSFPAGVTYGEALRALHVAQFAGKQPAGATVAESLPEGVAAIIPETPDGRVVLNTAMPFGFDTELGIPVSPTYTGPLPKADTPRSASGPWYRGWSLVVPQLPDCQRLSTRAASSTRACGPADVVAAKSAISLP